MAYLGQKEACTFPPLSFLYFGTPLLSFSRTCTADIDSITTVPKAKPDKLAGRTRLRLYTSNFSYIYAKLRKQEFPPLLLKRNFPLFFFFFLPKLLSPTVQGAIGERFVISVPSFFFVLQFLGKGGRKEKHFLPLPPWSHTIDPLLFHVRGQGDGFGKARVVVDTKNSYTECMHIPSGTYFSALNNPFISVKIFQNSVK